jgi:hypothetical protein
MSDYIVETFSLAKALDDEGFILPEHCREVRLIMNYDRPMMMQIDILLTPDDVTKIGRALAAIAAFQKELDQKPVREAVAGPPPAPPDEHDPGRRMR